MSKPGPFRRAPAILKRRTQTLSAQVTGGGNGQARAFSHSKKPIVIEVKLQDSLQYGASDVNNVSTKTSDAIGTCATSAAISENHSLSKFETSGTTEPISVLSQSSSNLPIDHTSALNSLGSMTWYTDRSTLRTSMEQQSVRDDGGGTPQHTAAKKESAYDDAELDVWDIDISPGKDLRQKDSVSTQVDFPSRAMSALTRRLLEHCHNISPVLATRAAREDLIDKLATIVDDAATSTKARFLLEQILAYKSRIVTHSSFMTRHSKVLMEISPKAYRHLKVVGGTGLLTLPCKATLRNRYPEVACSPALPSESIRLPEEQQHQTQQQEQPHQVLTTISTGGVGEEQVVLEVSENPVIDELQTGEAAETETVGTVGIHEVVGQTPTYYYVVPGGEESVLLSNVIMDPHVDHVGEPT